MIDREIEDLLRSLGLTAGYRGYLCTVHALRLLRQEPERLELISKRLYPDVAKLCRRSPGAVERAIHTAARQCGRRNSEELLRLCGPGEPSAGQFLSGLLRRLNEDYAGGSER